MVNSLAGSKTCLIRTSIRGSGAPLKYCLGFLGVFEGIKEVRIHLVGYEFGGQTPIEPGLYQD